MSRRPKPELTVTLGSRPLMLALVVCFSMLASAAWAQSATPDADRKGAGERITSYELTPVSDAPAVNEDAPAPAPARTGEVGKEAAPAKVEATKEPAPLTTEQRVEQLVAKGASKEKAEAMVAEEAKQAELERTGVPEGREAVFAPVSNADGELINSINPNF